MIAFIKIHYQIAPDTWEWININDISRVGKDYIYINKKRYKPVETGDAIMEMIEAHRQAQCRTANTLESIMKEMM